MEIKGNVGQIIQKIRIEKGLSQMELGLRNGISQPYVSQIEKGERRLSWEMAEKIALSLEVPITALQTSNPPHPRDQEETA